MSQISMKDMIDAGVHFGHQTQRWNPKMSPYVFAERGGIHIIDLKKTLVRANKAADFVKSIGAKGGRVIFVGTKKQAADPVKEAAQRCGQYYVTKRWLGGTLTNFQTIKTSIDRLKRIDQMREKNELSFLLKKERAKIEKEYDRLCEYLSGIREMKEAPQCMFIVDLNKEHIAVAEARRLNIPVVGIADTNSNPETVDYPIPGNDDAIRSIKLFANLVADSLLNGLKEHEMALRADSDKEIEAKDEKPVVTPADKADPSEAKPGSGPSVIKVSRQRKLVAAGLAEQVEIEAELDSPTAEDDSKGDLDEGEGKDE